MKTGKNEAQSVGEMLADMNEAKEKGLTASKGKSVYKVESGEYQEAKLRELISMNIKDLAEVATKERVSLDDVDEVKRRTVYYMRACEESGTFPSSLGLARSLGYSDRALRHWRNKQPHTKTAQWLELVSDMCADILSQSALKNNANNIMAIFLNKALYELRESSELVITPNTGNEEEAAYSVGEIRSRYLIDGQGGDNDE